MKRQLVLNKNIMFLFCVSGKTNAKLRVKHVCRILPFPIHYETGAAKVCLNQFKLCWKP